MAEAMLLLLIAHLFYHRFLWAARQRSPSGWAQQGVGGFSLRSIRRV